MLKCICVCPLRATYSAHVAFDFFNKSWVGVGGGIYLITFLSELHFKT